MSIDEALFLDPPVCYRSLPFWAWNDRLEPQELVHQIKELKRQGFGGFFMHSRDGLETPYLSSHWDTCIQVCVETARELGMQAWLYDEDRWPSGSCGGLVSSQVAGRHALKGLTLAVTDTVDQNLLKEPGLKALYAAVVSRDELQTYRRLSLEEPIQLHVGEVLLIARLEVSKGSVWFNGSAPPDNLAPETVQAFLTSTHEHYRSYLQQDFGTVVPGIFTDEPSLADRHAVFPPQRGWIPWSTDMDEFFQKLGFGDIYATLPYVYFNGIKSFKTRHDYWRAISLRYEACYSAQIGSWCVSHGLAYTGHFLQEDKLGLSTRVNGSIMPHYTHEAIPGIDMLGEQIDEYLTIKQCSSVAHQYGKKQVLSETYAGCGWDFSFEGQKWLGEWQFVLGVTNRCSHLMLYSLRGSRKCDYPQSFNYHSQWWEKQRTVEDYFARLSLVLQTGDVQRPILLIHPMSTVWGKIGCSPYGNPVRRKERDVPLGDAVGYGLNNLLRTMAGHLLDPDLGDETLLMRDGRVDGNLLSLKSASYHVVVLPRMETLFPSTYDLLTSYVDQGGTLVVLDPAPTRLAGEECAELATFFAHPAILHVRQDEELCSLLSSFVPPLLSVSPTTTSLHVQIRQAGSTYFCFIVNTDRTQGGDYRLTFMVQGLLKRYNLLEGTITEVPVAVDGSWEVSLPAAGSALYSIEQGRPPLVKNTSKQKAARLLDTVFMRFPCPVTLSMPNALTLDTCSYSLEGSAWSTECFTWQAQKQLREHLGMVRVDTDELEQRYRWIDTPHPQDGKEVRLRYRFYVQSLVESPYTLCLEEPQLFSLALNGQGLPMTIDGWYLDKSFKTVRLSGVHLGENVLEVGCRYTHAMSLEDMYLIGNFSVDPERRLGLPVVALDLGSWTNQGLFHFPGSVTYRQELEVPAKGGEVLFNLGAYVGVGASLSVNGETFELPFKEERVVSVTKAIKTGRNSIAITVYGSPRNLLGPLHLKSKPTITRPGSFFPDEDERTSQYQVVETGLLENSRLLVFGPATE